MRNDLKYNVLRKGVFDKASFCDSLVKQIFEFSLIRALESIKADAEAEAYQALKSKC